MASRSTLRKYQRQAAQFGRDMILQGNKPLVVLPTGAGKTVTAAAIIKELQRADSKKYKNVASLCHTTVLREQIGKRIAGIKSYTIQEFLKHNTRGKVRRLEAEDIGLLFVDEAHHIVSTEYKAVLDLFPKAFIFGMSATPERADGTGLGDVFDCMYGSGQPGAPGTSYSQLIEEGYLVDCELYHYEDLSRQRYKKDRKVANGVTTYLERCKRPGNKGWRPGIFFAKEIATCDIAARQLNKAGVKAEVVDYNTEDKAVQDAIQRYVMGDLDVLCSSFKLAEGFDAPRAEVCILSRSCDHVSTYLQCVGRVIRPYGMDEIATLVNTYGHDLKKAARIPKETSVLIDCTSAHQEHGLPTKDRKWSLDGKNGKSTSRYTFVWNPDTAPVRPYTIVELDCSVVEATKIARLKHFEQKLIKEGVSKEQARIQALKETGETSTVRFIYKGFLATIKICNCCNKQIKAFSEGFLKFSDTLGNKECYYHSDCWINHMPENSKKHKKVA